ncbi:MAG: NUDIX hydrolase [Pseudomonadota bacterium]
MTPPETDIVSAKAILYLGASLVSILRDDYPHIPWPNRWDLPGGGVEEGETPLDAVIREIEEEIGLRLPPSAFVWHKTYRRSDGRASRFFAAPIDRAQIAAIVFGDEGQRWTLMDRSDFISRPDAVPHYRDRVADFFASAPQARAP